jgi:hypothetical protein
MSSDRRQDQRRVYILRQADPGRERIFPCAGRASSPHVSRQRLHGCSVTSTHARPTHGISPAVAHQSPAADTCFAPSSHRRRIPGEWSEDGPDRRAGPRWLVARTVSDDPRLARPGFAVSPLTCAFSVERVTGIEPALSAWESVRSALLRGLTCGAGCPLVTVRYRSSPGLMAANGPATLVCVRASPRLICLAPRRLYLHAG